MKFPRNSFPLPHPAPFPRVPTCPDQGSLEKKKCMLFGFPRVPSPAPSHPGIWSARGSAITVAGNGSNPGGSWGSQAPCHSVPQLREASPGFGPFQLKLASHEPRGNGHRGSGRGCARWEGAAQSTYMRRSLADGCQEFPMRGDGGKFGQLGLANGEPREGSAPSPRPRPPRLPQRKCVRLAQCAWRLGPSARPEAGSPRAQPPLSPPVAAFASSAAAEPGAGERARPRQPSPDLLPPHARADAVAQREGGGRNPAPSTRAPSWTIMILSKPTITCSQKRTGTGTCSWTRPGRSSRERLAAAPAHRSPQPRPALPTGL